MQAIAEHRLDVDAGVLGRQSGADHPPGVVGAAVEPAVRLVLEGLPQREGESGRDHRPDRGRQHRASASPDGTDCAPSQTIPAYVATRMVLSSTQVRVEATIRSTS